MLRPGKKIPVWYVLITTVIQSAVGQAGRLIAAAAVVFYFFRLYLGVDIPGFNDDQELAVYGLILGVTSVAIILRGRYAVVELATKVAAGILIVCTFLVYAVEPAPVAEFVHFFQLDAPEGSWLIIASFLGLLPTGIDVSLQASEWGKAKRVGMGRLRGRMERNGFAKTFDSFSSSKEDLSIDRSSLPENANEYCRRWFKIGLMDFRFGHVISFILAAIFMLLAAVWMYPSEVAGNAVMGDIARIFTESVGPSLMLVFLAGAMAATYSTAFNYFDGWPRVVGACCRNLFRKTAALPRTSREELDEEQRKVMLEAIALKERSDCSRCWARYICSGGCHHVNFLFRGDPAKTYLTHCDWLRAWYQIGLETYADLLQRNPAFIQRFIDPGWVCPQS